MQRVIADIGGKYRFLDLPEPAELLMPGIRWGSFEHALTPTFWVSQAWMEGEPTPTSFQLGKTLVEEVVVCLLGGHGAPAEVGLAAFARVREELAKTKDGVLSYEGCHRLLLQPLTVGGRTVHYRFARQRAKYLAGSLQALKSINEDKLGDVDFRDALCRLPGIGPKTASWIVRNRRASDEVAILDIHIVRACQIMSVFPERSDPTRNYRELEARFLEFCRSAQARASVMDSTMWGTMRKLSKRLLNLLVDPTSCLEDSLPLFQAREEHVRKQRQPRGLAFDGWRRKWRWATRGSVPKDPTGPYQ
jgi:thermostable 8-oxoguanine DNA glycosylase